MAKFSPQDITRMREFLETIKDDILTKEKNLGVMIIITDTFLKITRALDEEMEKASDEMVTYYGEKP